MSPPPAPAGQPMPITSAELTLRLAAGVEEIRALRRAAEQMAAIGDRLLAERRAAREAVPGANSDERAPPAGEHATPTSATSHADGTP